MPNSTEWQNAIDFALGKTYYDDFGLEREKTHTDIVDSVRQYLNENGIEYETFSYPDLEAYL